MKKYGDYGRWDDDFPLQCFDVDDAQKRLPKSFRIRNKKQKRRVHNKKTRAKIKAEIRIEL